MAEQTERRSEQARRTGRGNGETADERKQRPRQAAENGQAAFDTMAPSASEMFAGWQRIQGAWLGYLQEQLREAAEARAVEVPLAERGVGGSGLLRPYVHGWFSQRDGHGCGLTSELATAGLEPLQTGFPTQSSDRRSEQRN